MRAAAKAASSAARAAAPPSCAVERGPAPARSRRRRSSTPGVSATKRSRPSRTQGCAQARRDGAAGGRGEDAAAELRELPPQGLEVAVELAREGERRGDELLALLVAQDLAVLPHQEPAADRQRQGPGEQQDREEDVAQPGACEEIPGAQHRLRREEGTA